MFFLVSHLGHQADSEGWDLILQDEDGFAPVDQRERSGFRWGPERDSVCQKAFTLNLSFQSHDSER